MAGTPRQRQRRQPKAPSKPFLQDVLAAPETLLPAAIIGLHEDTVLKIVIVSPRPITGGDTDGSNWEVVTDNGNFNCSSVNVTSGKYLVLTVDGDNSTPHTVQYVGGNDAITAGGGTMDLSAAVAIDEAFG